ncbi:MAG: trigger factor, partial [Candidatus Paceibacterota bacterium]
MDFKNDVTIATQSDTEIVIEGEIPAEELNVHRNAAIKKLGAGIEISGFRKGHVPENLLVEKIGEINILTEMAERALATTYPEIVKAHELKVIGHPNVEITKIAPGNPLGFKATVAVLPDITLPDYKTIAKEHNTKKDSVEVTDADVDKQVEDIMRQKEAYERLQQKAAAGEKHTHADGSVHDGPVHGEGTTNLPTPESEAAKKEEEEFDPENIKLPELTDEYVKGLGQPGQFNTVAEFKEKLKEHLAIEKEREVNAAHRAKITDAIIEKSEFALPQLLINSEISQMFAQMNEDLARANLKMDDYLTHIKKTKEDLEKEWAPAAEKRARLQLVLNEIAEKENVTPDQEQLEAQVKQLKEQYKDADEARVRVYVASVMTNEAVMQ